MDRESNDNISTSPLGITSRSCRVGEAILTTAYSPQLEERMDDKTLIQRIIAKIEVWLGNPPEPIIQEEEDNG